MELLELAVLHRGQTERGVWLCARTALDLGAEPEDVAETVGVSVSTLYRRLREQGLTYGRGRVASDPE